MDPATTIVASRRLREGLNPLFGLLIVENKKGR
jgi:hypothetical protein